MVSGNLTQSSGWDIFVLSDLWMRPDHDKILQLIPEGMLCSTMRETRVTSHTHRLGYDFSWWPFSAILWWSHCSRVLLWSCCCLTLSHPWGVSSCCWSLYVLATLVLSHFNNVPTGGLHCLCPVGRLALGLWVFPKERPGQGQGGTN